MSDKILLQGMQFYGYHGCLPEEQILGQWFHVDMELTLDLTQAALQDDLAATVDYSLLYRKVGEVVAGAPMQLIEAVAGRLVALAFQFEMVTQVKVRIRKPQAPIGGPMAYAAVEMVRTRAEFALTPEEGGAALGQNGAEKERELPKGKGSK